MPKTENSRPRQEEPRYPTETLLNSKTLAGYQRDFARVLLTKPEYTIQEAKNILEQFFKGGKS